MLAALIWPQSKNPHGFSGLILDHFAGFGYSIDTVISSDLTR